MCWWKQQGRQQHSGLAAEVWWQTQGLQKRRGLGCSSSGDDKLLDEHLSRLPAEEETDPPDVVQEESTGATAAKFGKNNSVSSRFTPRSPQYIFP